MKFQLHEPSRSVFAVAILLVLAIALADLASGPELSFGIFLLIPVMICAWTCTRWQRLAVCAACGCVWLALDFWSNQSPAQAGLRGWNAVLGLSLLFVAGQLSARAARQKETLQLEVAERKRVEFRLRELNDTLEQKVRDRTAVLENRSAELAQSEIALRRQAEVLESVLESMSDGVVVLGGKGQILLCNPEAGRWLRISAATASFRDWLRNRIDETEQGSVGPNTPDNQWARVEEAARKGLAVLDVHIASRAADGVERTATWNVVPLRNSAGQPGGAVAVGRDVTELANAQQRLLRSNLELERTVQERTVTLAERAALLELSFDAIIVRDAQDRITYWNKGAEEMYGLPRAEALGKVTHELFQTRFPQPLAQIQRELYRLGRWSGELVHTRRDGRQINVATRWALLLDSGGMTSTILESNSDITQQRQMEVALRRTLEEKVAERTAALEKRSAELSQSETALRRQAQVLQSILNSMGDGVIVADAEGHILLCNPEAEQLLGIERGVGRLQDALQRHEWRETNFQGTDPKREHPLIRALKGETIDGAEMLLRPQLDLQEIWVLTKTRPLVDEGGELRGTVMVFTDVTVRRSLEKQVAEISEREQRRIGQDLHDGVCQQLVSTAYACHMLAENLAGQRLTAANQASEIYNLINQATIQIRNLARALHPADLTGDGLNAALEELAQTVQDSTGIGCRCLSEGFVTATDQAVGTHLYRIAQEAVNNAVKHSHASQIVIELSGSPDSPALRISDNGAGIQPGTRRKKGIGFGTMSYRARMIGASLSIGPGLKGGTLVACSLPQVGQEN